MPHLLVNLPPRRDRPHQWDDEAVQDAIRGLRAKAGPEQSWSELPLPRAAERAERRVVDGAPFRLVSAYRLVNPDPEMTDGSAGDDFIGRVDLAWDEPQR